MISGLVSTFVPHSNLAAAYPLEGKTSEATAELTEARRINPVLTMKWAIEQAPERAAAVRRPAQGGAAGGMNAVQARDV